MVTLANTLLLLAMHPELQIKLHAEIDEHKHSDYLGLADLEPFHYLDLVMKESARILTPFPFVFKELTDDMEIGRSHL
jgi:cytochrome P450